MDKLYHFAAGLIIGAAGAYFTGKPEIGVGLAALAGGAKELYDKHNGGTVEALDFITTFIGGVVGVLLIGLAGVNVQ